MRQHKFLVWHLPLFLCLGSFSISSCKSFRRLARGEPKDTIAEKHVGVKTGSRIGVTFQNFSYDGKNYTLKDEFTLSLLPASEVAPTSLMPCCETGEEKDAKEAVDKFVSELGLFQLSVGMDGVVRGLDGNLTEGDRCYPFFIELFTGTIIAGNGDTYKSPDEFINKLPFLPPLLSAGQLCVDANSRMTRVMNQSTYGLLDYSIAQTLLYFNFIGLNFQRDELGLRLPEHSPLLQSALDRFFPSAGITREARDAFFDPSLKRTVLEVRDMSWGGMAKHAFRTTLRAGKGQITARIPEGTRVRSGEIIDHIIAADSGRIERIVRDNGKVEYHIFVQKTGQGEVEILVLREKQYMQQLESYLRPQ